MTLAEKLIQQHTLSEREYAELIRNHTQEEAERIRREAVSLREQYYGKKVYVRGLIEYTNYCKNDCYYCGIRKSNSNAERYRLSKEEIMECCKNGYELGFRTFVLQGGEDGYFTRERMVEIVREIRQMYPDCAITLSIGERKFEDYKAFREAGANRYLLRHETADSEHYHILHPSVMTLENRKECLRQLKELGYQTGAGFMVGSPGQTPESLAKDLCFLEELQPEMVGIGPFVPHRDTPFAEYERGSVELTLFLLSVIRILLPKTLLPATTALGTVDSTGREKGLQAGANVVMPNLSPLTTRKKYELYDEKICTGEEAAECLSCLSRRIESAGYKMVLERGDVAV